ncbi:M56 family metallopeptidase [Streptomyces sp. IB2014 016-6]|uniref:M56 family metallopeptidase n=1 Tax=Streptomyces sp. IB2014 016-6 TaxID=2517818 RepID=UPI00164F81DA|nr:M56 family metallopeptidase [Streptomyces sp. IB2014 016-6]
MLLSALLMASVSAVVTLAKWPFRAPCAALALWLAGFAGGLTALGCATYALFAHLDVQLAHERLRLPVDVLGVAGAWAFVVHVVVVYVRVHRQGVRRRERHLTLLGLFGYPVNHLSAVILPSRQPLAYSVPGPEGGRAVISDGVISGFTREEVASVLAHEHAHLRQRHHLLTQLSEALCASLPKRLFCVRFSERFHSLIEMRADCAARVKCGRYTIAQALARMAPDSPAVPTADSGCPVAARRRHLLSNERCCSSLASSAVFCLASAVAAAPAALTAAGALTAACTYVCH